ncbi:MAG: hypothetical protein A2821_02495 [Candidatus Magasanikbacteria bacterium RIFCSPHIGHO2_01_FULL_41_23]|uniref:Uncharacterized protein n=1 Tax=Candidatus Magasanikbacteria bacterium RIFCSPLOWO2_01_FULL_40_15 TaxID=1798686 RepID=A0A1F6N2B0_9BACT|nr:MAG: hypothetical protein A2821_02495 [Candidatus Magasanikbacteria bacterium RIFCSPHIGHO2_01_FULL_41_23]OGH66878.1 MAG: hypothetical protein A3C66_02275 [Candidatus Magasanikbacteria bacterium RIFCSPHIGHO2_02_FULL_41_35]OGH74862.1 MAG: hypothetical protein A3F22_04205 [Candidatus Magasanikbacteria bacterium RIFCSPHIGHO2_12_FULL_41_16]OGH78136.1 MAG: hypothetical protein A2983_03625 [Candidatus Magasanikbacteria bacterium RIFCSPLOWO2_01_FULL_40_15]
MNLVIVNQVVSKPITHRKKVGFFLHIWHRMQFHWYDTRDYINVKISQRQFKAGKAIKLNSLADLD